MFRRLSPIVLFMLLVGVLAFAACAPAATPVLPTAVPQPTALPAPTQAPAGQEVVVFAASSLTDSFKEIGQQFEAMHPGVKVTLNFAGSQVLSQQMIQGAKADVFASANTTEIDNVRKQGLVDNGGQIFANNRLVVIVPSDNPGKIETLADLAKPNLKLVIADKSVPVGGYTLSMLDKMSADAAYGAQFGATVLKNVVSQENNVKAVVAKVSLGEADAGVVYLTDATPDAMPKLKTIAIPDKFNQIAKYPIVALKNAPNPAMAQEFVAFVLGDNGQAILKKWNFIPFQ